MSPESSVGQFQLRDYFKTVLHNVRLLVLLVSPFQMGLKLCTDNRVSKFIQAAVTKNTLALETFLSHSPKG